MLPFPGFARDAESAPEADVPGRVKWSGPILLHRNLRCVLHLPAEGIVK